MDPLWVRANMGRPRGPRRLMAQSTGATFGRQEAGQGWPGGEYVCWPTRASDAPTLLYLHGGGFIACSPETHRSLVGSLVRRTKGQAWVPTYRLAPEHPFPAALDDVKAAYRHLLDVQGIDPTRLVLAGDSAGGGLALALALAIRDEGWPPPAALVTFCPWTDMTGTGASLEENSARCSMFTGDTIRRAAKLYVGTADPSLPYVSPVYGDFRGLPPLLVHASTDEVLRDDGVRVAQRAAAAGVPVSLRMWARVPHVWQFFAAVLPEARESLTLAVDFMRQHTRASR
ncbi:hypothetical protein GEMMAAP_11135 [Gemmatimonas phototrophica]|uniref:Alpha/beta hydrolase fold-3 domain-containing protein n=1 Tax=Gemmatimonas phototrophica TaxID=1379270 RepID=A0A145Q3Q8_9BACT|nr:hypothetical protein GEMMAAP_11135 [Gemmatimonas phototrophica]